MKCDAMFSVTAAFVVCLVISAVIPGVYAEETAISEKSFSCIRDGAV